jgi:glucose/arabinose dehydrogenase
VRYTVFADDPDRLDPTTAQVILSVPKRSKYHQAGMLAFGPDGYLYISVGDDEQSERAQDLGVLTGKILRLDVHSAEPYAIPASNPFVGTDARGEVWDYGLRNPWRFSFDRATGDLWVGDVHHVDGDQGQNWESIEYQPAESRGGVNFGFPVQTAFHCADVLDCHLPGVSLPVVQYDHRMNCSVTGGYVYRGRAVANLVGSYIFGDYCTGGVFAVHGSADQGWSPRLELGYQPIKISSFGEDPSGELYVVDIQGGVIYRVTDASLP